MITKIIAASDLHIKNFNGLEEIKIQFQKFIDCCRKTAEENGAENTRIILCGDLLHSKLSSSNEALIISAWFLKELDAICKTIVVCGNHDLNMSNLQRVDSITPVFEMCEFQQTIYIDKELGYKSGSLVDDNIVWCLYSTFDNFSGPDNLEVLKETHKGKKFIGLFHGDINGAKNAYGLSLTGMELGHFAGMDFVIAGHIHKYQELNNKGVELVYCGSLIQQNFGEDVYEHGYVLWDIENNTHSFIKIPNEDYGYYQFSITCEEDIDNDKEKFANP